MSRRVGAWVFGLVPLTALAYAAAASLGVSSGILQAGQDSGLQCDTTGVTVSYQVAFGGSPPTFRVTQVTVGGIDSACQGRRIHVVLTAADGSKLDDFETTVGLSSSVTSSVGAIPAADVHDVHVAIWQTP